MMTSRRIFVAALLTATASARASSPLAISETPSPNAFPLITPAASADIRVDDNAAKVVHIAADLLAGDIQSVTSHKPTVGNSSAKSAILVGTLGDHGLIDSLIASGKLDPAPIKDKWEATEIVLVQHPTPDLDSALVIAGSDRRGTAYGLTTLSQAIGVSPWVWWADVAPQKKTALYISLSSPLTDSPDVKYRGIFINDEDWGLNPWASKTFDPDLKNVGPKTYAKVFELMLRLRLNYIWPAMHAVSTEFGSIPENAALADQYAIVAGASHCEPMLYNNVHWNEKNQGPWNYATNKDAIFNAWKSYAQARGNYEAVWTLGIRGIHDAAMEAPRDTNTRIQILTDVIHDQRSLLDQFVTKQYSPPNSLPAQCFVPYKEVQPIYDAGLKVPDDVTLVWADDNFGYVRRFSNPDERKRPGGAGVYYHLSYYGSPHSYTWINTTAPALMYEELHKAWDNDARTLWVLNVGDIKPAEIGISYYADLAWHTTTLGPDSQPAFLKNWAAQSFGDKSAQPIADLLADYYRLGTTRKPEEMDRAWAASLAPDEAAQLESDYKKLLAQSESIAATIPADNHDAFTETVAFPAHVLAASGLLFLADRSHADAEVARLRADLESQVTMYNTQLAGGKWNHMMPGLETGKVLTAWSSQVRWPWGEKPAGPAALQPQPPTPRTWRDAASADKNTPAQNAAWTPIPGLAPSGHALALLPATLASAWAPNDPKAPSLDFNFSSNAPANQVPKDAPTVQLRFFPTFRIYPGLKLRVAISLDSQSPQLLEVPGSSGDQDERGDIRSNAVRDNFVQASFPLPALTPGQHTLHIQAVDPGIVLDRISVP